MDNNQIVPIEKNFSIFNRMLNIPENLDLFNSYRLIFRDLARQCTKELEIEYNKNIQNLDEFLSKFPCLYNNKIEPLIKKSIDILLSEGVRTVTYDSFLKQHLNDFHLAMDDYTVMVNNFNAALEENQQKKANIWGYVPSLIGGGFGLVGALKGIATATAYNLIRDGIEANSLKSANVKPEQRANIYKLLNTNTLFDRVFYDYWDVFLSLVWTLRQNGKNIWWPANDADVQANNIFINLSNPNFPQDKIIDAMLQILKTTPYNVDYYNFLISEFGETDEITKIKNYFGYTGSDGDYRVV